MIDWILAMALMAGDSVAGGMQMPACRNPLATLTVPRLSYGQVAGDPFEQRVYVYVPSIPAGGGKGFEPFQIWIVEGVYGKPFVQPAGRLDQEGFERLRGSQNVRVTPVSVVRGDGSDAGAFRLGRNTFRVQVLRVTLTGGGTVQSRICR